MKWLIVSSLFAPYSRGGAELVAEREALLLRDAGEEVIVLSSSPPDSPRFREDHYLGLRVIRYRPWHIGSIFNLPKMRLPHRLLWHVIDAANVHSAILFRNILRKEKPDTVLFHGLKNLGYLLPRVARRAGVKTLLTLHDVQLIELSGIADPAVRQTIVRRLWSRYTRALIGSPDALLFPSLWLKDLSERWRFFPRSKLIVLRNPIFFNADRQPPAASRPIRTLLFLGQLEAHKGIRELLRAVEELKGDYRLIVAGEGQLASEVKVTAEKQTNIVYRGRLNGEALDRVWREADLVIVPSTCAENAPTVIQEAAAHSVPVIASRTGGILELVREGGTGWLVPPGDRAALRQELEKRIGTTVTQDMRRAMAEQAEFWSEERWLREIGDVLRHL